MRLCVLLNKRYANFGYLNFGDKINEFVAACASDDELQ